MGARGALVVLEGCDKVGKSTQVKMLVEALNNHGIIAKSRAFPDRTTKIGEVLNKYLSKEIELPPEAAHLLFSANRWECSKDIIKSLQSGTTIIVDRYAASGAAYTAAATNKSLSWCQKADSGLPQADLTILIKVSEKTQNTRNWDGEIYENMTFQKKVSYNFDKLNDGTWKIVDGERDRNVIHKELLENTLNTINRIKHSPINLLSET